MVIIQINGPNPQKRIYRRVRRDLIVLGKGTGVKH